jgi:hypothetical protein
VIATFPEKLALHPQWVVTRSCGAKVYSCDYNGWADVPEEEREGIDAFEAVQRSNPLENPASVALELRALEFRPGRHSLEFIPRKAA